VKNTINFFVVAAISVSVAFVGCKKDDKEVVKLLKTITTNTGNYTEFGYDEKDRIIKVTNYTSSGTVVNSTTLTFNGDELVKSESGNTIIDYAKTGNTIAATISATGSEDYTVTYFLNNEGFLIKAEAPTLNSVINFQYQGSNMNKTLYDINGTVTTFEYKHDNTKSPFRHCKSPQWFLILNYWQVYGIHNNIVEINIVNMGIRTVSYEFDADGYPTKMTVKTGNNEVPTTFSYISK